MEFRHLRYFLAGRCAALHRAFAERLAAFLAGALRADQAAEQEVVPLFDRGGRSVQLTRAGSIFRDDARRASREMELAQVAIAEEARGSSGDPHGRCRSNRERRI
ncbi:MAG: hypothetical protein IPL14_08430 [Nitrospira sp.]|nr:hypothetical protein [Nitrospira sp.]